MKNTGYVATGLRWLRDTYGVPARIGAPVRFEGKPGVVVGYADGYARIRLHGETRIGSYHPRHNLIWLEEYGPATAVPTLRPASPAPMFVGRVSEPQWSGV